MSAAEPRFASFRALFSADAIGNEELNLEGLNKRARAMAEGVWENRAELDAEIAATARKWRIGRMPAVDRSLLRLSLYELRHTSTPVGVVISEAVEIAKRYSTERSGSFVNGVLGKLAEKSLQED